MKEQINELLVQIKAIWIKRRYIIIFTWLLCPIGWMAVYMVPSQFESTAKVYVDTQSILAPLLEGMTVEVDSDEKVSLMVKTLLSRTNLVRIIRMTDLDLTISTDLERENLIVDLAADFTISKAKRDNIYTLSVKHPDPTTAKNIVEAALLVFIENTMLDNRTESNEAKKFIGEQISVFEERLADSEKKIAKFKQKHSYELPRQSGGYYAMLNVERTKLEDSKLNLELLEKQYEVAKNSFYSNPDVISYSTAFDHRVTELNKLMDELMLSYTDKHPRVKEVKARISWLKKAKSGEIKSFQTLTDDEKSKSIDLASDNKAIREYQMHLTLLNADKEAARVKMLNHKKRVVLLESRIHTIPEIEASLIALTRNYEIKRKKYENLLDVKETATLAETIDQTTDKIRFEELEPPLVANHPVGYPKFLMYIAVAFAGVGAGVGVSFLLAQINPVIMTSTQITTDTGFEVYGEIDAAPNSNIITTESKKTKIFIASNSLLFCLMTALVVYSLKNDIMLIVSKVL